MVRRRCAGGRQVALARWSRPTRGWVLGCRPNSAGTCWRSSGAGPARRRPAHPTLLPEFAPAPGSRAVSDQPRAPRLPMARAPRSRASQSWPDLPGRCAASERSLVAGRCARRHRARAIGGGVGLALGSGTVIAAWSIPVREAFSTERCDTRRPLLARPRLPFHPDTKRFVSPSLRALGAAGRGRRLADKPGCRARRRPHEEGARRRPECLKSMERVKGIEPSTRSLGSFCSTTELHPPSEALCSARHAHGQAPRAARPTG